MKQRLLVSWSSGKDSAWMLYQLQQQENVELIGLLTSFNNQFDRVAMHGVRRELVQQQALACELPLFEVELPFPCTNEIYEQLILEKMNALQEEHGITHVAYGDLFLEDIRDYRIKLMAKTTMQPLFPIWGIPTDKLAEEMLNAGLKAYITCIDPKQIPESFAGSKFDLDFLNALPENVDRCGENGEFHSFTYSGPMYKKSINVTQGETLKRDGFIFTDLINAQVLA